MSGFFGDLSSSQEAALREMKGLFAEIDDHTALRFLRARHFEVKDAANLYRKNVAYRKESGIEKILKSEVPKTDLYRKFVPHAFHGFDREGRPIYIEKVGLIDYPTAMTLLDDDDFMRHHLYQMEKQIARCAESSARLGKVVDNFCTIVDLTGLNMSHRKALRLIRAVAGHDQDHYPERLGKLYIINAPWIFPTFWRMCRVWLDANTVKKINVLGKNYKKELVKHIDPVHLPEEYGGTCKCPGGCVFVHDISMYKNGASLDEELKASNDTQEKTISSRDCFEVKLSCGPEGGEFSWVFKVQGGRDLLFSVQQLGGLLDWSLSQSSLHDLNDPKHKEKEKEKKPVYVQEPEKIQCHKGNFSSAGACTLVFKFDNTHSYFTSKSLKFCLRVAPPPGLEADSGLPTSNSIPDRPGNDLHMEFPSADDIKSPELPFTADTSTSASDQPRLEALSGPGGASTIPQVSIVSVGIQD